MKSSVKYWSFQSFCAAAAWLAAACAALGQSDDRLVGVWVGQGLVNTVELLLRSDGHYQVESTTEGSQFGPMVDRGRYEIAGRSLRITSYNYSLNPDRAIYDFQLDGDSLSLTGGSGLLVDLSLNYQLKPGSRADVLAREQASHDLVRRWTRHLLFEGDEEWTFRPGGYYVKKSTSENVEGFVQFQRGRYEQTGTQLILRPYGGSESQYEVDIFGTTLTLISTNDWSSQFTSSEEVPGSAAEVASKAAEAQTFLSAPHWQAGVWQIHQADNTIDLLLRPDGFYTATNTAAHIQRVLRGRYTLAGAEIDLIPFIGQERWVLDGADFGIAEQAFTVDYYDGELQLIDHKPGILQSVTLARQSPGTHAAVLELVRQAQAERDRDGWHIGLWEAKNPAAWMEFTFRPDNRYIAKSGTAGVASEVERGQYVVAPGKITLAPYAGTGPARGFELDLYDGSLFLIGDSKRLVIVRKIAGSETGVSEKARDPAALKGERGSILGLWTANRPSESVELVFRQDGQFRLKRCANSKTSYDYGIYMVDMASRTLIYDSRFAVVQTQQFDFYGDTMTIYGGTNTSPSTYTVNLGVADATIAASFAADDAEAQVDAQWLARVPIGPADTNAMPEAGLPADPNPGQILQGSTVFSQYEFYRRLIPRFLHYTAVVDSQQWHFMPGGRVLVRFTTWSVDLSGMATEFIMDAWGAYQIEPKPTQTDILHCYADNGVTLRLDVGDIEKLTLEDGRRSLFWGKEYYPLSLWVAEQKPIACQAPANPDASLINTGLSLSTGIAPDPIGAPGPLLLTIAGPVSGAMTLSGSTEMALRLVLERAADLVSPIKWEPSRTNSAPAGPFSFTISWATNTAAFFRVRSQ
jgi:hypothetical protein